MWVPFCVLSQEMRHKNFFGGPKMVSLGGGQEIYVEQVAVPWFCHFTALLFSHVFKSAHI